MSKEEEKNLDREENESAREQPVDEASNGQKPKDEAAEDQQSDEQKKEREGAEKEVDYESLGKDELIESLEQRDEQIDELQQQLTETQDKHLRKVAELDNMKKRINRERTEIRQQAKIKALEDFLPINDDLQRTLNAAEGLEIDDKFLDGVKMVADKFDNVLKQNNVERIDETMVPFDVDKHEAMMRQPAEDKDVESNTVLQILENGYRIGNRTIRHAKVIVSE